MLIFYYLCGPLWVVASPLEADLPIASFSRDGDSAGAKAMAYRMRTWSMRYPRLVMTDHVCSAHANHLMEAHTIQPSLKIIGGVYSTACLLRMGSHYMRLIHSIPKVVLSRAGTSHPSPFFLNEGAPFFSAKGYFSKKAEGCVY